MRGKRSKRGAATAQGALRERGKREPSAGIKRGKREPSAGVKRGKREPSAGIKRGKNGVQPTPAAVPHGAATWLVLPARAVSLL